MPIAPLLQTFIDEELTLAPALVARVLAGTKQLLGPSGDTAPGRHEKSRHGDLLFTLQRHGAAYEAVFVESLRRRVYDELDAQRDGSFSDALGGLELMDESRVEADIDISRASQLIDSTAEWELRELQTFTSTLTGHRHVSAESNPFRPLVYASALRDAACAVTESPLQQGVLLRTSSGVAAGLLKNAWAAASTRLESQGVEPGLYRTVVLPSPQAISRDGPGGELPRPRAFRALLAEMPVAPPAGSMAPPPVRSAGAPASGRPFALTRSIASRRRHAAFEQALLRLDERLRRLRDDPAAAEGVPSDADGIEQHRLALVASVVDPADRQAIDLVTRLFDAVRMDGLLPAGFVDVFARMQIAYLRAAIDEPDVLDAIDHPAWRLLDRIGEVAAGYARPEDPRLGGFMALCSVVAEELAAAAAPGASIFNAALERLDLFLTDQFRSQLDAAQGAIETLQAAERREALQQHLGQRLADRLTPVRATPAIRRFLTVAWAGVIAESMLRHGEQSPAAIGNLKTVDDLLWSLQIPHHPQSRQRLLQLLPGLLQRLRSGMEFVALPDSERQAVLNDLMAIHTEALRPGSRGRSSAATPEQIVQRMRDEVLPEQSPSARSFDDSLIDVSSMETVPAEHLPGPGEASADDPGRRIEALRAGSRHRVFLQGRWSRVQLLWRSDRGLFFLFAGEAPSRRHSITGRALERLNSAGLLQPLAAKPLVQRSTERMMRGLQADR